jgi:hypothetical protein
MASILACNSRISLSIAGSGIGLSLLLDGMAEKSFFFPTTESKDLFYALIPQLTQTPFALGLTSAQDHSKFSLSQSSFFGSLLKPLTKSDP